MRRLVYPDSARDDLAEILRCVGRTDIALRFTARLREQCRSLAALPGTLGRARPELREDLRSFAVAGYVILFRYGDRTLEIVNVVEGHRDVDALFRSEANVPGATRRES